MIKDYDDVVKEILFDGAAGCDRQFALTIAVSQMAESTSSAQAIRLLLKDASGIDCDAALEEALRLEMPEVVEVINAYYASCVHEG